MAIEAGLVGAEYGVRPSTILGAADLPPTERYRLDADVFAAQKEFEGAVRERARESATDGTSPREQRDLVASQQGRADQREQMAQAGLQAPAPDGQVDRLAAVREQRAEAAEVTNG